jgi:hypothetical protein
MTVDYHYLKRKNNQTGELETLLTNKTWVKDNESEGLILNSNNLFAFDIEDEEEFLLNLLNSSQNNYIYYFAY